jgi:hypothetical protein
MYHHPFHPELHSEGQTQVHGRKVKGKVKLSLCFNWAPRHEGVLGERKYSSTHSLTSALDGSEWSASLPGRFTPREKPLLPTG